MGQETVQRGGQTHDGRPDPTLGGDVQRRKTNGHQGGPDICAGQLPSHGQPKGFRHLPLQSKSLSPSNYSIGKHVLLKRFQLFVEDGRKIHQTYGSEPVRIQLGVGMSLPGLDKGLVGVCKEELRKIQIPYRLAQRAKSKGGLTCAFYWNGKYHLCTSMSMSMRKVFPFGFCPFGSMTTSMRSCFVSSAWPGSTTYP